MALTRNSLSNALRMMTPVAVLAVAIAVAYGMMKLRPKTEDSEPTERFPTVQAWTVEAAPVTLRVRTQGTVSARTETVLTAEVSGLIEWVSPQFADGGFFEAGDELLRIDALEYESHLAEARSRLAQAELVLEQERAQSEQARQDWEELGRGEPTTLVLRKPQLARAQAEVEAARAQVRLAERNLTFTRVRAPYSGRILRKEVDVGQAVTARGTPLARIYSVEVAEVRLPITAEDYRHIDIREDYRNGVVVGEGPEVLLFVDQGGRRYQWRGVVARAEGVVDTRSRLTYVVAQVENPYAMRGNESNPHPPLKVGQFVEAEIEGRRLDEAFLVPREAVHQGRLVYVIDEENRLYTREVKIERMDAGWAVVSDGLRPGERICITPLLFFVEGMQVSPEPAAKSPEERERFTEEVELEVARGR